MDGGCLLSRSRLGRGIAFTTGADGGGRRTDRCRLLLARGWRIAREPQLAGFKDCRLRRFRWLLIWTCIRIGGRKRWRHGSRCVQVGQDLDLFLRRVRPGERLVGPVGQGDLHEAHPDGQRGPRARLLLAERLPVVKADPRSSSDRGRSRQTTRRCSYSSCRSCRRARVSSAPRPRPFHVE